MIGRLTRQKIGCVTEQPKMLIKALSIKQPWANLIASGEKTIETRLWGTDYRGQLLIVSSKTPNIPPAGYALAIANLVDCRPMTALDEAAACCAHYLGAFAWVMRDIRIIPVFPVRGKLGLYDVSLPSLNEDELGLTKASSTSDRLDS
jgi:hypothetical protein